MYIYMLKYYSQITLKKNYTNLYFKQYSRILVSLYPYHY